jgi:drug/metabolite transporter (DMT)-like permease
LERSPSSSPNTSAGLAAVSAAAILWAISAIYARTLIDKGASPLEIAAARAWIAFAVLGAVVWLRRSRDRTPMDAAPPARWVVVAFGLSIAGANYFYYSAIARLPVAVAIVIQYTAPALVVLWLAGVERKRPSTRVLWALAAAIAGVALLSRLFDALSSEGTALSTTGILFALGSAVSFATYIVLGERMAPAHGPEGTLARGFGVAGALWIIVQITRGRPDTLLDGSLLPGVILLGFIATVIPFMLFVWGLQRIGAARAGIISTLEPMSAAFLAYVWLDQTLDAWQIAGAGLVIIAIAVVQTAQASTVPTSAPLD